MMVPKHQKYVTNVPFSDMYVTKKRVNIAINKKIIDYYKIINGEDNKDIFGFSYTNNDKKLSHTSKFNPYSESYNKKPSGVLITSIHLKKLFALNGLKPGDIIKKINNVEIWDSNDLKKKFIKLVSIESQQRGGEISKLAIDNLYNAPQYDTNDFLMEISDSQTYANAVSSQDFNENLILEKFKSSITIDYIEGNPKNTSTFILTIPDINLKDDYYDLKVAFKKHDKFFKIDSISEDSILSDLNFNEENKLGFIKYTSEDNPNYINESFSISQLNNQIKKLNKKSDFIINFKNENEVTNKGELYRDLKSGRIDKVTQKIVESTATLGLDTGKLAAKGVLGVGKTATGLVGINSAADFIKKSMDKKKN